ncbi:MAG: apolipoprotein acyltransferase [Rhodobacter sp.]|nr:apolipoprotein acyltransferase [Rhodobacter sp.]
MIVIVSAIAGIVWGGYQAKRRGGNRKDMAQYAAGYGIAFTLLGLVATVVLERMLV